MDLMVIEMDDFELVIGNTFMRTIGVGVFPQLGSIMVMNNVGTYFVCGQGRPSRVEDCTVGSEQLLAMDWGCKRGDLTYLTVMVEI